MSKDALLFCVLFALIALSMGANHTKEKKEKERKVFQDTVLKTGEKRILTVFYEALCPDSEHFMAQLGPVYDALKDYIQLEFVPYGLTKLHCKRQIHGKCEHPTFACKHGPAGCKANRQHDCALQYSESQEKQMQFILCTMGPNKLPVNRCLDLLGFSQYDVDTCMTFNEGTELQLKSHEKTKKLHPSVLPMITFDQTYNQEIQDAAIRDFRVLACSLMANKYMLISEQTAPELCKTHDVFLNLS